MSKSRIHEICDQISELEKKLDAVIGEQSGRLPYQIDGKRVIFNAEIEESHQHAKMGLLRWFMTVRPQNYLTMPFIYGMTVPLLFLDLCVSFFQLLCFPVYRIPRVKRADYFVMDHQHLAYLNMIEKMHCLYCSYVVGLLAYATEITARTEQYFCPIKHARKILGVHSRYGNFLDYGEAERFHEKLQKIRIKLANEAEQEHKRK
uniref:Uncharacterized protein n=1 Tax=Candidatus Nitrotoga fabula TaxID=2182327 RepID=A0A2X0R8C4_9PROT|nr:conserved protein of unknown function [Candidatus Nitrotoga fabula]